MKSKTTKRLWIAVGIGALVLMLLIIVASVINLGERLAIIHPYVAYGFYGLSFILTWFLIINPIRIILFSPAFNIETVLDKPSKKRYLTYKKVASNLMKNDDISQREKEELKKAMKDPVDLLNALQHLYNTTLKKKVNKVIFRHAKTVMISTAISQNGRLDFFATLTVNIRMVKEIVVTCGFRPSFKNLSKLLVRVMSTALIAEGLENIDFTELLPSSAQSFLRGIPFARVVTDSIAQGIGNGILTMRVGIVTRKYLFADSKELSTEAIRRGAFVETIKTIPSLIKDSFQSFPDKIKNMFRKKPEESESAA
jgi:uncharacterized membrane protein